MQSLDGCSGVRIYTPLMMPMILRGMYKYAVIHHLLLPMSCSNQDILWLLYLWSIPIYCHGDQLTPLLG
jgi:hypothetical protein